MVKVKLFYRRRENKCLAHNGIKQFSGASKHLLDDVIIRMVLSGHAGIDSRGNDPVCAALTASALAFCESVAEFQGHGVICELEIANRGNLDFEIKEFDLGLFDWLSGLSCGFYKVLQRILGEYPNAVCIERIMI